MEIQKQEKSLLSNTDFFEDNINLLETATEIKNIKLETEQYKKELKDLPPTREVKDPLKKKEVKEKRKELTKKIKKAEKEVKNISKENPSLILDKEKEEFQNLARRCSYKPDTFMDCDLIEFEKHKKNILYKFTQMNENNRKYATNGLITILGSLENVKHLEGCSKGIRENRYQIDTCMNEILIDLGKKDVSIGNYINPYTALGLVILGPVVGAFIENYQQRKEGKKKDLTGRARERNGLDTAGTAHSVSEKTSNISSGKQ